MFVRGIESSLKETFDRPAAGRSEIAISLAYGLRSGGEARPRRIYIFSDMLERSMLIDMMGRDRPLLAGPRPEALAGLTRRILDGGFDVRLDGADIAVFGFGREDARHQPLELAMAQRVRLFWTGLFMQMGARSFRFFSDLDR